MALNDGKGSERDAAEAAERVISKAKGAKGRKGKDHQEAALNNSELRELSQELVLLKKSADDAATDYGDAVKAAAEKTGYHASTIRSVIAALAGDDFDGRKGKAEQLSLAFEALA
jgi:hypothetical protein